MKEVVLGIDLQFDFCNPEGSLFVKNADADVKNINAFIRKKINDIDAIIMSMDSHQPVHIAHDIYWKNDRGQKPQLFGTITAADVASGNWIPQYNADLASDYLTKLEKGGGVCTIWPPHCIIGTRGWSIDQTVFGAIEQWAVDRGKSYELVNKGMYQAAEHYSIFRAAVEYPGIGATLFNDGLLNRLKQFDAIYIVGEAADFCVSSSLNDLLQSAPELAPRIYMLTDCMSHIIPDNAKAQEIFGRAESLGVKFRISSEL